MLVGVMMECRQHTPPPGNNRDERVCERGCERVCESV